ncbi:cornifin-B [Ditylenchus destructor]|uniref:Cornifin-B n=1 Tax=Ditylenchus destructor TaxID=166010 RepID=A0AAD4R2G8_9BILA|nr:cornifin-B [Ditylenchus destructor]
MLQGMKQKLLLFVVLAGICSSYAQEGFEISFKIPNFLQSQFSPVAGSPSVPNSGISPSNPGQSQNNLANPVTGPQAPNTMPFPGTQQSSLGQSQISNHGPQNPAVPNPMSLMSSNGPPTPNVPTKSSGQGSLVPPGLNVPDENSLDPANQAQKMPQSLQTQALNPSQVPNSPSAQNQPGPGSTPETGHNLNQMNGMLQMPNMGSPNSNEYPGFPSDPMSNYAQNFVNPMSQYPGNMPGMLSSHKHSHGQNSPWDQSLYSMSPIQNLAAAASNNWQNYGEQNFESQQTNDYDYGDDDSYPNPFSLFQGQNSPFSGQYASGHKPKHHHHYNDYSNMFGSNFDQSNSYGANPFGQGDEFDQSNGFNPFGMNAFGSNQGYNQGSGQNSFGNGFGSQFPMTPNTHGFFPSSGNSAQNFMPGLQNGQNPLSQAQNPYGQNPMNPGHQTPGFGQTAVNPYAPNQNPYAANPQMNSQGMASNPQMNLMASMPNSGALGQNLANMPQSVQNPGFNGNPGFGGQIPLNFASGTPQTQQQLLGSQNLPQAMGLQAQNPMMPQAQNPMMPQAQNPMMPQAQNPMMPQAQNPMMPQAQNPMMPQAQNPMMPQAQNPMMLQVQNPMTPQNQMQNPMMTPSAQNPAMMTQNLQQTPGMSSNMGQPFGMQPQAAGVGSNLGSNPQKCINQANDVQCSQYAMTNMCSQHKVDCAAACGGC